MPIGKTPEGAVRWSINRAAAEFNTTHQTLNKRLLAHGVSPDEDGCYSTQQIGAAVFGDKEGEKIRLTKEQADKLQLENAKTRKEMADMNQVERVWTAWAIGIRDAVRDQEISADAKQTILAAVRDVDAEDYFKDEEATTDEEPT